ncbi:MAG: tRNA-(ms[2]io[6]A)-hydroxylase [Proteobacteria bacterium]|jgi:tRNA-(ms[2]io[6]A)-hydroxylase|nr:tRNA-(ms[2]io[6]A)-hydroxylase [Pseudomonadota bacterium]MDA1299294.1 tRNA-(ms[2]io[6]A)-hydroxylase [Pseudomonadota bacterium]
MMNVNSFLHCGTPDAWLERAAGEIQTLLIDHANCEKKAASTAINLMYRYVDKPDMLVQLSKLAREELRHFEQVLGVMADRGVGNVHLSPSRYASALRREVRTSEPGRLVDILINGAIIEARSCERFERLSKVLDADLAAFYSSLMKSESRHFGVYLDLARDLSDDDGNRFEERVAHFLALDAALMTSPDPDFRFHSGVPMSNDSSE